MIYLEPVSERTFMRLVNMKLPPELDRFVAPNVVSLAQAWLYYKEARPFAICLENDVVGFMMLDWDEGGRTAGLWRFMIASEHQHMGYGRKALEAAIRLVRDSGLFDLMELSYVPENTQARALYYSLGFRENGEMDDDEIVMTLPLTDSPSVGMLIADGDDMDDFLALIEAERLAGQAFPAAFSDTEALEKAVSNGCVRRFTLMGRTIGLAWDGALLLESGSLDRLEEARAKLAWK